MSGPDRPGPTLRPWRLPLLLLLLAAAQGGAAQATTSPASTTLAPGANVTCLFEGDSVVCDGLLYNLAVSDHLSPSDVTFWIYLILCIVLVLLAGCMSGLTLGLLSLDLLRLDVIVKSGEPTEQKYAKRIMPLVKRRHLLLVVLLLTNAAAMEALPIFLDKLVPAWAAILMSVTAVLFFGEIIPQALCSRYGLIIGGNMFWLPWILIVLEFPVAWPIAKLLDCLLGSHHIDYYKHAELKELVSRHGEKAAGSGKLTLDETTIIGGALEMRYKTLAQVMTPLDKVFMLDINGVLDAPTLRLVQQMGHSRVPVYDADRQNLQGLILVKELIGLSPADRRPIREILLHPIPSVQASTVLLDMLNEFQLGHSHLSSVVEEVPAADPAAPPATRIVGIVTLEDVLEELLQEEILDEHDHYRSHKRTATAAAAGAPGAAGKPAAPAAGGGAAGGSAAGGLEPSPLPMKMKGLFKNTATAPADRKPSGVGSSPPPVSPPPAARPESPAVQPASADSVVIRVEPVEAGGQAASASPPRERKEKRDKREKKARKREERARIAREDLEKGSGASDQQQP